MNIFYQHLIEMTLCMPDGEGTTHVGRVVAVRLEDTKGDDYDTDIRVTIVNAEGRFKENWLTNCWTQHHDQRRTG